MVVTEWIVAFLPSAGIWSSNNKSIEVINWELIERMTKAIIVYQSCIIEQIIFERWYITRRMLTWQSSIVRPWG